MAHRYEREKSVGGKDEAGGQKGTGYRLEQGHWKGHCDRFGPGTLQ